MRPAPRFTRHAGGSHALVELQPDHPGFSDAVYRQRRDTIARIALEYRSGQPVPDAPYTDAERGVWRLVLEELAAGHERLACREVHALQEVLPLPADEIPQLSALNPRLEAISGFRMEPVAGLVSPRTFLRYLGRRVFLSTQYIRHHSRPTYTPEPDVIHELVGHAATLVHPGIAELNSLIGEAVEVADETELLRIERVYWYTLEFGLVEEDGAPRAFGAGLLSSIGELTGFHHQAALRPWDLEAMAGTPYDPTRYQDTLFVAPSFTRMLCDVAAWVRLGGWRGPGPAT